MSEQTSADEWGFIGRDRVRDAVQDILRAAQLRGWSDEKIGNLAKLKPRLIKSYRTEDKVPNLAAALCIAAVLGEWAVMQIMALIGYQASPLEGSEALNPNAIVAEAMKDLSTIAAAAADGRFDHTEMPSVTHAADELIATIVPLSSAGRRS
jgi:hypothetical protein